MKNEMSVEEAAAAIVALINSRPQTPRKDEIEGIVGKVAIAPEKQSALAQLRPAWRALVAEADATGAITGDIPPGDPREAEAAAVSDRAEAKLEAFHEMLWQQRAESEADVRLLAEVAFREFWPGLDLTGPGSDEALAGGPHHSGTDRHDRAFAAVLKAIRDRSGAVSPQALGEPTAPEAAEYRELLAQVDQMNARVDEPPYRDNPDDERMCERFRQVQAAIVARPPETLADFILLAEIAEREDEGAMCVPDGTTVDIDRQSHGAIVRGLLALRNQ